MARALWKGSLTFGLVTIPVEVRTAVRDRGPRFRLLRKSDKSPIRYRRVAERDEKEVSWDDLVKGHEYQKGHFVILTPQDFERAALEKTRTIDILDFVPSCDVDDRFFNKPYYLTAGAGGDKAYALLREAIRDSGRIGIAKFIMREKQHLAAVEAVGEALVLSTMRFADELVKTSELEFPAATSVRKKDLELAKMLIDNLATDWEPARYTDEYTANLMKIIQSKQKGRKTVALTEDDAPRGAEVVDLMERLRRSLQQAPKSGKKKRGRRAA